MEATARRKNEPSDEDDVIYAPPVRQHQQQQHQSNDSDVEYRPSGAVIAKNKPTSQPNQGFLFILNLFYLL